MLNYGVVLYVGVIYDEIIESTAIFDIVIKLAVPVIYGVVLSGVVIYCKVICSVVIQSVGIYGLKSMV